MLIDLFEEQKAIFSADPGHIAKLLSVGEKRNDGSLNQDELAAGTVLGIALFNHDAAIMRR